MFFFVVDFEAVLFDLVFAGDLVLLLVLVVVVVVLVVVVVVVVVGLVVVLVRLLVLAVLVVAGALVGEDQMYTLILSDHAFLILFLIVLHIINDGYRN